jgi:hypothetical protein
MQILAHNQKAEPERESDTHTKPEQEREQKKERDEAPIDGIEQPAVNKAAKQDPKRTQQPEASSPTKKKLLTPSEKAEQVRKRLSPLV